MRIAIYARVSTGSDDQANALEQQIDRLRTAASQKGDSDPLSYIDIASGSRDDRPELARLLRDCAGGTISIVLVTRLDRVTRSSIQGAKLLKYFSQDHSPNLVALDDSLDLANSGGRFMARMLVSWAEAESDRLGERTAHGHKYRRAQRKTFGWKAPYGYELDGDGGLVANQAEFPIAQQAIEKFLQEPISGALRTWFMDEQGHQWGNNFALRRWLCNPTLAGARAYGQRRKEVDPETGSKRMISRPPGEYGEIYWENEDGEPFQPPLVTRLEHARILSIFEARANPEARPLQKGKTRVMTGLLRCGDCGRIMEHHVAGKRSTLLTLRCVTPGCISRWKTLRADEVAITMLAALQLHAKELFAHVHEVLRAQEGQQIAGEKALRSKIQQLEAMDDPDLKPVIEKKREELVALMQKDGSNEVHSFLDEAKEFQDLNPKQLLKDEPELIRHYLQHYVRAEASVGELELIYLAEAIRRPGQERFISVKGLGMGRPTSKQCKAKLEELKDKLEKTP